MCGFFPDQNNTDITMIPKQPVRSRVGAGTKIAVIYIGFNAVCLTFAVINGWRFNRNEGLLNSFVSFYIDNVFSVARFKQKSYCGDRNDLILSILPNDILLDYVLILRHL